MVGCSHDDYSRPEYDDSFTCETCPENHFCLKGGKEECPENSTSPTNTHIIDGCTCNMGYQKVTISADLFECQEGQPPFYYIYGQKFNCESHMSNSETNESMASSTGFCRCKPGYFLHEDGQSCVSCGNNEYSDEYDSISCQSCPIHSGHVQTAQPTIQSCQCNAGYEGSDVIACAQCPVGKYKSIQLTDSCLDCPDGKYADTIASLQCKDCFADSNSAVFSDSIDDCTCNSGFEKNDASATPFCQQCIPGKYRDLTVSVCTACSDRHIAPGYGNVECDQCFENSDTVDNVNCLCIAGYSGHHGSSLVNCLACSAGTYSVGGQDECTSCGDNTISTPASASLNECRCIEQFEQNNTDNFNILCTQCVPGKFKNNNEKNAVCETCQENAYPVLVGIAYECQCNAGYTPNGELCRACEKGKFKKYIGDNSCNSCNTNQYSDSLASTQCLPCPYYSVSSSGSDSFQDCYCNTGYAHEGGVCELCTSGKYSTNYMGVDLHTGAQECAECPSNTRTPQSKFPWGSSAECFSCKKCNNGLYALGTCDKNGDYTCSECPDPGSTTSTSGYHIGLESCLCKAGFELNSGTCQQCTAGKFKSDVSNAACSDCEGGSYTNIEGSTECSLCPMGMSSTTASTQCLCDIGYSPSDSTAECIKCAAGKYKDEISNSLCIDCEVDTVQVLRGQASCDACPGNLSTLENVGSAYVSDCRCDLGFGVKNDDECHACIEGHTFSDQQSTEACKPCQLRCGEGNRVETYCNTISQLVCRPCQANSNSEYTPGTDELYCACNAGYELNSVTSTEKVCEPCEVGKAKSRSFYTSYRCHECVAGRSFSDREGQILCTTCDEVCQDNYFISSECTIFSNITCQLCSDCPPGEQVDVQCQSNGRQDTTCMPCEVGFYCPGNGVTPTKCPDDSSSPSGSTAISNCVCNAGYELTTGPYECQACGANTYCFEGFLEDCPSYSHSTAKSSLREHCICNPGFKKDKTTPPFTCIQCPPGEICGDGGTGISCPDPLMTTDAGASSVDDCFCIDGYKVTESNACVECLEDVYCIKGDSTDCPDGRLTNGQTARYEVSHCFCRPGYFENAQGDCAVCQQGYYCPGDNSIQACTESNQVPDSDRAMCVCDRGYEMKQGQCFECQPNYYKNSVGNHECVECEVCVDPFYVSRECTSTIDTECESCVTCEDNYYYSTPCDSLQPGVCSECSECDFENEYKTGLCTQSSDTECTERNKTPELCSHEIDKVRGKESTQSLDKCISCELLEAKSYFGVDLHYFTSYGKVYNDKTSCGIACREGSYADPNNLHLGCKSCEHMGNYLFKNMQQTKQQLADGSSIFIDCGFECKEPFAVKNKDGTDCIRNAMKGGEDTFFSQELDLSQYEKTSKGFKFTITYTQFDKYMILVSKSNLECGPYNKTTDCCSNAFRISHRSFSGLPLDGDMCGKSPDIINADDATRTPLAFTIKYEFLNEIADCETDDFGVKCRFVISLLDVTYTRFISRTVEIQNDIGTSVMRLHNTESYIPLAIFDVQILWLRRAASGNTMLLQFQMQKKDYIEQDVGVHVSLPGAALLEEVPECARIHASVSTSNSSFSLESGLISWAAAIFVPQQQDQISMIATMVVENKEGRILLSHIGFVRNVSNYLLDHEPQCSDSNRAYKYKVADVYASVGYSPNFKNLSSPHDNLNWIPDPYGEHTPGLASHLVCFVVMPLSQSTASIQIRRALSTHISNELASEYDPEYDNIDGLEIANKNALNTTINPFDFTFKFRAWCRSKSDNCQYEYHTLSTRTMHVLYSSSDQCSGTSIQQARDWLKQNFGLASDNHQLVNELCNFAMQKNRKNFAIVFVNTKASTRAKSLDERFAKDPSTSFVWLDASLTIS